MGNLLLYLSIFLLGLCGGKEGSKLLDLSDSDFSAEISKYTSILVLFLNPQCEECKLMKEDMESAVDLLSKLNPPSYAAIVDGTHQPKIIEEYEISNYPSVIFFLNNLPYPYTGDFTAEKIYVWIKSRINQLLHSNEDYNEDQLLAEFEAQINNIKSNNSIADLKEKLSQKLCFEFSQEYFETVFEQGKAAAILFLDESVKSQAQALVSLCKASKNKEHKIAFAYSGITKGVQEKLAEFIGVESSHLPRLFIINFNAESGLDKFLFAQSEITEESILQFVADFRLNKIPRHFKSEEIPTDEGNEIKKVVNKNFKELVSKSDIFLMFVVPWCEECKQLYSLFTELSKVVKQKGMKITFGQLDISKNEIESVEIMGYPSFKYFKKGNISGIEYSKTIQITNCLFPLF